VIFRLGSHQKTPASRPRHFYLLYVYDFLYFLCQSSLNVVVSGLNFLSEYFFVTILLREAIASVGFPHLFLDFAGARSHFERIGTGLKIRIGLFSLQMIAGYGLESTIVLGAKFAIMCELHFISFESKVIIYERLLTGFWDEHRPSIFQNFIGVCSRDILLF
jgi:hypothetical protein